MTLDLLPRAEGDVLRVTSKSDLATRLSDTDGRFWKAVCSFNQKLHDPNEIPMAKKADHTTLIRLNANPDNRSVSDGCQRDCRRCGAA